MPDAVDDAEDELDVTVSVETGALELALEEEIELLLADEETTTDDDETTKDDDETTEVVHDDDAESDDALEASELADETRADVLDEAAMVEELAAGADVLVLHDQELRQVL